MRVDFWGVRGSIPTPLTTEQIQAKIQAVVQRISVQDLKNQDSRQAFLDNLPSWLNGTVGGNTSCVSITNEKGTNFILDAGSGIRLLGKNPIAKNQKVFHIFFSHFHFSFAQVTNTHLASPPASSTTPSKAWSQPKNVSAGMRRNSAMRSQPEGTTGCMSRARVRKLRKASARAAS